MTKGPPPTAAATAPSKGRAALIALRSGKVAIAVVSLLVLTATGTGWGLYTWVNSGITRTDVFEGQPTAKPLDGAIDILLVGMDSRTDAQGNPLPKKVLEKLDLGKASGEKQTDTMILVHIPQDGKSAVAFSFPRDSYVRIAGGWGKHKLNSAYVYAYNETFQRLYEQTGGDNLEKITRKAKAAGRKNLITTIERFIGRPGMIDRYAEVNLASFYHITKALGGIKVCLNHKVHDPKSGVDLPAGVQTIKGKQALAFVRQRYGLDDGGLDRIRRQQAFLAGVARKILSAEVLLNPARLADLISAVQKSVVLSEGWDLWEFAKQMRAISAGDIKFYTIPTQGPAMINGASVLKVDVQHVRSFITNLIGKPPNSEQPPAAGDTSSTPEHADEITVGVYNGSGKSGLGKQVRNKLSDIGYQGHSYATITSRADTTIQFAPGERDSAKALRDVLGVDAVLLADSDIRDGHLKLLIGEGFHQAAGGETSQAGAQRKPAPPSTTPTSPSAPSTAEPDPITAGGIPCVD